MEGKDTRMSIVVVLIAVTALVCAAINMHINRNMLDPGDDAEDGQS